MSTHGSPTTRRFVRTAWIMLIFQLIAAAGAVAAAIGPGLRRFLKLRAM